MQAPWYRCMLSLQSSFLLSSVDFFRRLGYDYALVPQTTDSISSPVGLGSE